MVLRVEDIKLVEPVGTPQYVSPELVGMIFMRSGFEGAEAYQVLRNTDAHAFNVAMYAMNTGRLPFTGKTAAGIESTQELWKQISSVPIKFMSERRVLDVLPRTLDDLRNAVRDGVQGAEYFRL